MRPHIPLTDPKFEYTPSHKSDIRVRFGKERAKIEREQEQQNADTDKVVAIFNERREKA